MSKKVKIVAAYSRVSDDDSADKSDGSLVSQEFIDGEIAHRLSLTTGVLHRIEYVLTEKQGRSGGNTARPEYQKLWNLISARKIDAVVAKDIARLNRSLGDFCDLMEHCRKHGVSVHVRNVDIDANSPFGDMIFKLLALIAEFERTLGVQRTRDGVRASMVHKKQIHGGRVLLGFERDRLERGRWKPNASGLKLVERILDLIPQYDSYPAACEAIRTEGIRNFYGGVIDKDGLRRMIRSRKYEGINEVNVAVGPPVKFSKDIKREKVAEVELGYGPVVNLEKLGRARAKLAEWDRTGHRTRRKNRVHLLSGLLVHEDGSEFKGDCGTSKTGKKIWYYKNRAYGFSINADELEKHVVSALSCFQNEQEIQGYVEAALREFNQRIDGTQGQIATLRSQMQSLRSREKELADSLKGMPSARVTGFLENQLSEIDKERAELELGIERLEREKAGMQSGLPNTRNMKATLEFVFENFDKAEDAVKRNFMRQVFEKIVVYPQNRIGLFWKFPETTIPTTNLGCDTGGRLQGLELKWGDAQAHIPYPRPPVNVPKIIEYIYQPLYRDRGFLYQKYVQESYSVAEISRLISSSRSAVREGLRKHGIPLRPMDSKNKARIGFGEAWKQRKVIANQKEQEVIRKMLRLREEGLSYWKVAGVLNAWNVPTKTRKGSWSAKQVHQILVRSNQASLTGE